MATWGQLRQYIDQTYRYEDLGDDRLKLLFSVGGGRTQAVLVLRARRQDSMDDWALIESAIGKPERIDLHGLLAEVSTTVCGGLAQDRLGGNLVVFRHAVPLASLDINEFEQPLHLVVGTADALEQQFAMGTDTF